MFQIEVNSTKILFSKFFSTNDVSQVLAGIGYERRVLFINTSPTSHLVSLVEKLTTNCVEIYICDNHDVNPRNVREAEIHEAANRLREVCGHNARITDRVSHPACSTLIEPGEFRDFDVIVADSDAGGLLGALKAIGIKYEQLDSDAAVLDGPRAEQTADRLSKVALQFIQGLGALPQFNPDKPEVFAKAKANWYNLFAQVILGRQDAAKRLAKILA